MAKYLIVNADDFGMCKSANEAVFDLFQSGYLKSATIMMPCPTAKDAVDFSIANPQYAIGIHLTMTSEWKDYRWKPLTDGKTLCDEHGFMWRSARDVGKHSALDELEKEARAQIDLAHKWGMKPSHVDNHMGSLYGHLTGRFSLLKMTLRLCGEYGYAYRMFLEHDKRICPRGVPYFAYAACTKLSKSWAKKYNVLMPDYLLFPDWGIMPKDTYENYRKRILEIWCNIPDGITETFVHPAKESDELKGITGNWWQRVWEYRLMKDEEAHRILKENGVTLISYRELIEMKS